MRALIERLPTPNQAVLKRLVELLITIVRNSDATLMQAKQLAVCVGANLTPPPANTYEKPAVVDYTPLFKTLTAVDKHERSLVFPPPVRGVCTF